MLTNEQIKEMIEVHTFYNSKEAELMSLCRAIEQAARREALEEAAKLADSYAWPEGQYIADEIRERSDA